MGWMFIYFFFHYWCTVVYKVSVVDNSFFGEFDELLYHTL